eukprot:scaffold4.g4685.t1
MLATQRVSGACSTSGRAPPLRAPRRGGRRWWAGQRRGGRAVFAAEGAASAVLEQLAVPEIDQDHEEETAFCGMEGHVMSRPAPGGGAPRGGRRYHIRTFGCQMNLADSERMAGVLESLGYACAEEPSDADVLIYNTCSIREKAEQKVYSALGKQAKRKRQAMGDLKIVVAGCVAAQEGQALLRRVPELDLVMGPHHANRLGELLERVDQGVQVVATEHIEILEDITAPRRDSDVSAWVNVIYGCNERCTYCIVPFTRGQEQSRTPEAIRREMLALGEAGIKEVTLLGQNIDAYGRDLPGMAADSSGRRANTFTDLLRHVHDVPGIERIRFATSHPRYFTERLIRACAELPKLCEFFHIPFQSAAYSPRPGTPAAEWDDQASAAPRAVADLVKADRLHRLNAVVNRVAEERAARFAGRALEVLVEGPNPRDPGQAMGRTRQNKLAFFPGDGTALKGRLVTVQVEHVRAYTLIGRRVD